MTVSVKDVERIANGWDQDAAKAKSIHKDAYINPDWHDVDRDHIFRKSWQYLCHENQLPHPGTIWPPICTGKAFLCVGRKMAV